MDRKHTEIRNKWFVQDWHRLRNWRVYICRSGMDLQNEVALFCKLTCDFNRSGTVLETDTLNFDWNERFYNLKWCLRRSGTVNTNRCAVAVEWHTCTYWMFIITGVTYFYEPMCCFHSYTNWCIHYYRSVTVLQAGMLFSQEGRNIQTDVLLL
jgi:hypothetical protein